VSAAEFYADRQELAPLEVADGDPRDRSAAPRMTAAYVSFPTGRPPSASGMILVR